MSDNPATDLFGMIGGSPDLATTTHPMTYTVTVGGSVASGQAYSFSPANVTIKVGDTIHWVWKQSPHPHNVVSGTVTPMMPVPDGRFCNDTDTTCDNAPLFNEPHSYDHTFGTAGSFPYLCAPHFDLNMTGTITVQ